MKKQRAQTFNDGVLTLYSVEAGRLTPRRGPLRYEERTVGVTRFYTAKQNDERVDLVLRIPRMEDESALDVCVPRDGQQYAVRQVQHPRDVLPPVSDLSLERLTVNYGPAEIS